MRLAILAAAAALLASGSAHAVCTTVGSDVVSVGQKSARAYSERSLTKAIASEQQSQGTLGLAAGRVTKGMECKPYPNLIGADEWRCIGNAKVCSK